MDDMVSMGLHDFLFGEPTAHQPSTLQPINTVSTLVGSICCQLESLFMWAVVQCLGKETHTQM